MAIKRKVVSEIALAIDKRQYWIEKYYPIITAIESEFGSVEECVKAARYGRECANQEAWRNNYQEESSHEQ